MAFAPGPMTRRLPSNSGVTVPFVWSHRRMELPPFALTESKYSANLVKFVFPGPMSLPKLIQATFAPLMKSGTSL